MSSYNLKNKQTIQISGLILQYCSATTLYRRLAKGLLLIQKVDSLDGIFWGKISIVPLTAVTPLHSDEGPCVSQCVSVSLLPGNKVINNDQSLSAGPRPCHCQAALNAQLHIPNIIWFLIILDVYDLLCLYLAMKGKILRTEDIKGMNKQCGIGIIVHSKLLFWLRQKLKRSTNN